MTNVIGLGEQTGMDLQCEGCDQAHGARRPNRGQFVFIRPEGAYLNSSSLYN